MCIGQQKLQAQPWWQQRLKQTFQVLILPFKHCRFAVALKMRATPSCVGTLQRMALFCTQLVALCRSTTIHFWRGTKKSGEMKEKEKLPRVCKGLKAFSANTGTSLQQTQRQWWCSYRCDHSHYSPMGHLSCRDPQEALSGFKGDLHIHCGRAEGRLHHHAGPHWDSSWA